MAAFFKYFAGIAVVLSVVIVLFTMTMSEIFAAFPTDTQVSAAKMPRWNSERLKRESAEYIGHGSLSPIYPASPGKELFGRPADVASAKRIYNRPTLQVQILPL